MMRRVILLATCIFASSTHQGEDESSLDKQRLDMCTNRNDSVYLKECNKGFATMFIYNETTNMCEELPESICNRGPDFGVFYDMFTCTHTCAGGGGLQHCAVGPYRPSNGTCTEEEKESMWSFDNTTNPNRAWYYNMEKQECERYYTCRHPWRMPKGVNGYGSIVFCEKDCWRFHNKNINGSKARSDAVNCTGDPPARCPLEEEEDGWTRYFYNASAQECQQYKACEGDYWPKGAQAINYFVTQSSCELECGNCIPQTEVVARDDLFAQDGEDSGELY